MRPRGKANRRCQDADGGALLRPTAPIKSGCGIDTWPSGQTGALSASATSGVAKKGANAIPAERNSRFAALPSSDSDSQSSIHQAELSRATEDRNSIRCPSISTMDRVGAAGMATRTTSAATSATRSLKAEGMAPKGQQIECHPPMPPRCFKRGRGPPPILRMSRGDGASRYARPLSMFAGCQRFMR